MEKTNSFLDIDYFLPFGCLIACKQINTYWFMSSKVSLLLQLTIQKARGSNYHCLHEPLPCNVVLRELVLR